ncbi:hypothetical protein [Sphingomonas sp. PWP1-2]|uniref:hypothetical protein n=1 Tax=Sphingomonas sp. PWP1-2 TaxID=2804558 RepID=UPI003CF5F11A
MPKVRDDRMKLYEAGKNDVEIALAVGVSRPAIFQWRKCRGLLAIPCTYGNAHLSAERRAARQQAYDEGLNDREIGERVGQKGLRVGEWRKANNLPSSVERFPNRPRGQTAEKIAELTARRALYDKRMTDNQIAKMTGRSVGGISNWRAKHHLPRNPEPPPHAYVRTDPTLQRIRRAIGRMVAPDIADDAASDMYVALLTGDVQPHEIERRARTFAFRSLRQFADRWGNRSLDMAVGWEGNRTLLDILGDETSASWLENMGATMW